MIRKSVLAFVGLYFAFVLVTANCSFDTSGIDLENCDDCPPNSMECACTCTSFEPLVALSKTPEQSEDDAEEYVAEDEISVAGASLDLGEKDGDPSLPQIVGIRFPNITLPETAVITSAHIQFTAGDTTTEKTRLLIQGELSGEAQPFNPGNPKNISSRTATSEYVRWPDAPDINASVPGWTIPGESGPDQRTPDLSAIIQEILAHPDWVQGNAMAIVISGTGHREAVAYDLASTGTLSAPTLEIGYQVPTSPTIEVVTQVCPPPYGINFPSWESQCEETAERTLIGLLQDCNYPSNCTCELGDESTEKWSRACEDEYAVADLEPECENFDPSGDPPNVTATNAPGDTPVWTAHSPLAASIFGRRSRCVVEGNISVEADGKNPERQPDAAGVIEIEGDPCPGEACAVGLSYMLDLDPVKFSNFWGSATFRDLAGVGGTQPGGEASLTPAGDGTFGPDAVDFSVRGRKGSDVRVYTGANQDVIDLSVGWGSVGPSCAMEGALIGVADPEISRCENAGPNANEVCESSEDCEDDPECSDGVCDCVRLEEVGMVMDAALEGDLINQPPTANAGDDQIVECNLPGKARFSLDGSGSDDPDDNIAFYSWFRGSRVGPAVGFEPSSTVEQPLDAQIPYILRVIDSGGQADEDSSLVGVVDTTPPEIFCNTPNTIVPPDAPISFAATAADICDPDVPAEIGEENFECFKYTKKGKWIDKRESCVVSISGDTITILDSGGVGDYIRWNVQAVDASGNMRVVTCGVDVVRP